MVYSGNQEIDAFRYKKRWDYMNSDKKEEIVIIDFLNNIYESIKQADNKNKIYI